MGYLKILLIVMLAVNIAGCTQLKRTFTRKSDRDREEHSFYRIEEYRQKPPHQLYQESYILWHNWHMDLLRMEGTSRKRDITATIEALKHLTAMRDLLVEEKAKELDLQIAKMEGILERLKKRRRNVKDDTLSRRTIERLERVIINMYTYRKMKDYIKSETDIGGGEG